MRGAARGQRHQPGALGHQKLEGRSQDPPAPQGARPRDPRALDSGLQNREITLLLF